MSITAIGRSNVECGVSTMRRFRQGNISAKWLENPRSTDRGRLPPSITLPETTTYVVYSYLTPIAWYCAAEKCWYMPHVWYSPTTTRHQDLVLESIEN